MRAHTYIHMAQPLTMIADNVTRDITTSHAVAMVRVAVGSSTVYLASGPTQT